MSTAKFSCVVTTSNTDVPLGCEIWIDDVCIHNTDHVQAPTKVEYEFDDIDSKHTLRVKLKNKLPEYTVIDDQGNILSDALLSVTEFLFDEIDCTQIVHNHAVYYHNFNSIGPEIQDQFFGDIGCNGTVELDFATPVYLWLLENM